MPDNNLQFLILRSCGGICTTNRIRVRDLAGNMVTGKRNRPMGRIAMRIMRFRLSI